MIKRTLFLLLILCSSTLFATNYITNVEAEPGHANLNHGGSLKFFYDLTKPNLVKKAYLQTDIDGTTVTFDTTVTDSGFLSIDNSILTRMLYVPSAAETSSSESDLCSFIAL